MTAHGPRSPAPTADPTTKDAPTEIRWHARGGQGAKTAATFLAESAIDAGLYAQGFPEYGPERMGAPMRAYNRIGAEPIRVNAPVRSPDIVIVLDETLFDTVDVAEGTDESALFLINSHAATSEARHRFRRHVGPGRRIHVLNAERIALETIGRPIPNTPMVGAMLRATHLLPVETVVHAIQQKLGRKFPPHVVQGNVAALKRAYEETVEL
jgi:pyruvate ferredoxin oxidoreductase gamma subunit